MGYTHQGEVAQCCSLPTRVWHLEQADFRQPMLTPISIIRIRPYVFLFLTALRNSLGVMFMALQAPGAWWALTRPLLYFLLTDSCFGPGPHACPCICICCPLKLFDSLATWPPHLRLEGWRSFVWAGPKLMYQGLPKVTEPCSL